MAVQFILGRSGTGKTSFCIKSIIDALLEPVDRSPLLLLVPEQATYQAERAILNDKRVAGSLASTVVVSPDTSQLEPVPESGSIMYTPASPSQLDDIILSISGQFPTSNAKISAISHSVDDSIISLEIATEWTEDEQDTVVTSWTTEKNIGRFEAGIYQLVITINSIEFLTSSLKVREKSVGQGLISMDFNLADGDQGQRIAGSAIEDSVYTVQLTIRTGSSEINGWSVSIDYDSDQLEYVGDSFAPGDFIPGLVPLVDDIAAGTVSLGGTVLGSPVFGSGSGTLGTLAFEVLDGFTESVDLIITENSFRFTGGMRERYEAYSVATITRAPVEPPVVGDFDGSGKVDFLDFFEFADAFGGTNLKYDLDGSGKVDFDDFFTFADSFGKEVRAKLMELARQYIGLPAMPQLQSNYPNPFNTSTTIRYQIIESGLVQLDIFDLVGQRTRSLISGIQEPGSYEILWDGANEQGMKVSTGIYLAKLQVGTFNDVRKMLLVK